MKDKRIDWTAAAVFALVLALSSLWGAHERAATAKEKAADLQAKAQAEERDLVQQSELPVLSKKETSVLRELISALENRKLKEASIVISREEELFVELFYEKMDGRRYLFDGQNLKAEIDGEGLVLTKAGTVFYGSFQGGRPHGSCLALQVVDLEAPRYDYADGLWQNGVMEGEGSTGYCYYQGGPIEEARAVCRKGRFSGNLMEGKVTYRTTNDKKEAAVWNITVKDGVVVLDDRWTYLKDQREYQLMATDNDSHAYVLGEDQARQPMWANILQWEEEN